MLTSLRLQNFKSWADTGEIRLAPITGLFGTNSSGKTSILQLLLLLKQTVESTDRAQVLHLGDNRSLVDLGTFNEVMYRHAANGAIEWSFAWTLPKPLRPDDPEQATGSLFRANALSFSARIVDVGQLPLSRPEIDWFQYRIEEGTPAGGATGFGMHRDPDHDGRYDLTAAGFEYKRPRGRPPHLPAPVKFYGFPDQVFSYYQNTGFLADLQLALEELFGRIYYLGPLRQYPRREYTWAGAQPSDMGRQGERVVDALLASRTAKDRISRGRGKRRRSLEEVVAIWLKNLGMIDSFTVKTVAEGSNLYRVYVRHDPGSTEVLITDVGFGVSQILPVLALCYYVPEGSTVILEQPEIHLHPSVQAGLADVLIDAIRTRDVQIILESHSEHLLRRLQRRIAEESLRSSEAAMYFCEMNESGTSYLTPLHIDQYGNITNWPDDFFGDEFGELAAMTKAEMERRLASESA